VLPLRGKVPLTGHGVDDATDDLDVVRGWWSQHPRANIGAAVPPGLLVLDIDPRNGGSLAAVEESGGPIPPTLTAWSGRSDGGRHLYFLRPAGALTGTKLPPGVDLKVNGYCVMPPSVHPVTGTPYWWEEHDPVPLPTRLRELLLPVPLRAWRDATPSPRGGDALVEFVAARAVNVNDALYWAACRAAETGLLDRIEADLVAAAGQAAAAAGTFTPAGERQSRRTVDSARRTAVTR